MEQFEVDSGYVLHRDLEGVFHLRATTGRGPDGGGRLPVSSAALERLVTLREGFVLGDARSDLGNAASVLALSLESVLAVPLSYEGRVAGGIVLHHHRRLHAFSPRDLHVANGIAAQVSLVLERLELLERTEREAATRGRLGRFLPTEIVDRVVSGAISLEPGGREGEIVVLYCDIRGFTTLTRQLGPRATMDLLNEYYQRTVPVVFAHGGMVDKFVGDELMAVWGVLGARPDDVARALACGLALQRAITALGEELVARGQVPFACGIGVDAGLALVGLLGSTDRLQYTVIGEAVNMGARFCGFAGAGQVVTRRELVGAWPGSIEALGPRELKGAGGLIDLICLRG